MTTERRLAAIEGSLSPTQLVLRWLDEAHAFGDLTTYTAWLLDQPDDVQPADRLAREAIASAKTALRGKRPDEVDAAVRRALRETIFRFELVLRVNVVTHETLDRELLIDAALSAQLALLASDERKSQQTDPGGKRFLASCRDLATERIARLRALEGARSTVEARYLDGHPALFPDLTVAWDDGVRRADGLANLASRLAELDGIEPPALAESDAGHASEVVARLVEPAKVTALEKLGDTQRAMGIATRWVRSILAAEAS